MENYITYTSVAEKAIKKMSTFSDSKISHIDFEGGSDSNIIVEGHDERQNKYTLCLCFINNDDYYDCLFEKLSEEFVKYLELTECWEFQSIVISNAEGEIFKYDSYDGKCTEVCKWVIELARKTFVEENEKRKAEENRIKLEKMKADHEILKKVVEKLGF